MYKILLADDEGIVIDSVKYIIAQNFPHICEVESAKTGRKVIEMAESFRPDIIFMDIQMPGINGIDAMKEIKKSNLNVTFIVMSAYDKFDYAKEAINLGVMEYLHKPVNQNKIVEVLQKAMGLVDKNKEKRSQDLQIKEKLEIVVPMIEQGFVSSGLFYQNDTKEIENYKNLIGITQERMFSIVLEFGEELENNQVTNPVGTGVRLQNSYESIREFIKEIYPCYVGSVLGNQISCCVPTEMKQGDYESRAEDIEKCRKLVQAIKANYSLNCRIGIGSILVFEKMGESFRDAMNALKNGKGSVVHCRDLPIFCEYEDDYPVELEVKLFDAIKAGQYIEVGRLAKEFFEWMEHLLPEYENSLRLKVLEFVLFAERDAYKSGGMIYRFGDRRDYLENIVDMDVATELKNWFTEKMLGAAKNISTKKKEYSNDAITKAKEYIQVHYKKDLSLEFMSREMDMSPYYFSKLFKEVTGENFIEYLTTVRIERAKTLLLEGGVSMKEICLVVGYSDPNYFSRIFKKCVGKTPTEFKEGGI